LGAEIPNIHMSVATAKGSIQTREFRSGRPAQSIEKSRRSGAAQRMTAQALQGCHPVHAGRSGTQQAVCPHRIKPG
jgi:uncharacterized protein involved in propanediol utilization